MMVLIWEWGASDDYSEVDNTPSPSESESIQSDHEYNMTPESERSGSDSEVSLERLVQGTPRGHSPCYTGGRMKVTLHLTLHHPQTLMGSWIDWRMIPRSKDFLNSCRDLKKGENDGGQGQGHHTGGLEDLLQGQGLGQGGEWSQSWQATSRRWSKSRKPDRSQSRSRGKKQKWSRIKQTKSKRQSVKNLIKSPSDTTLYWPALHKEVEVVRTIGSSPLVMGPLNARIPQVGTDLPSPSQVPNITVE